MKVIQLQQLPSQVVYTNLDNQACKIQIHQKDNNVYLDLEANSKTIVNMRVCKNYVNIINKKYLGFKGDLVFIDVNGDEEPNYKGFTSRFCLIYLGVGESLPKRLPKKRRGVLPVPEPLTTQPTAILNLPEIGYNCALSTNALLIYGRISAPLAAGETLNILQDGVVITGLSLQVLSVIEAGIEESYPVGTHIFVASKALTSETATAAQGLYTARINNGTQSNAVSLTLASAGITTVPTITHYADDFGINWPSGHGTSDLTVTIYGTLSAPLSTNETVQLTATNGTQSNDITYYFPTHFDTSTSFYFDYVIYAGNEYRTVSARVINSTNQTAGAFSNDFSIPDGTGTGTTYITIDEIEPHFAFVIFTLNNLTFNSTGQSTISITANGGSQQIIIENSALINLSGSQYKAEIPHHLSYVSPAQTVDVAVSMSSHTSQSVSFTRDFNDLQFISGDLADGKLIYEEAYGVIRFITGINIGDTFTITYPPDTEYGESHFDGTVGIEANWATPKVVFGGDGFDLYNSTSGNSVRMMERKLAGDNIWIGSSYNTDFSSFTVTVGAGYVLNIITNTGYTDTVTPQNLDISGATPLHLNFEFGHSSGHVGFTGLPFSITRA